MIDRLRETVGWKQLTPAEVAERCENMVAALRAALGEKLIAVALYGSWARGDAGRGSDVDLLVIARDLRHGRDQMLDPRFVVERYYWATPPPTLNSAYARCQ